MRLCRGAGSLIKDVRTLRFHELRHTAISLLIVEAASIIEVGGDPTWSIAEAIRRIHNRESISVLFDDIDRPKGP